MTKTQRQLTGELPVYEHPIQGTANLRDKEPIEKMIIPLTLIKSL